MDLHEFNEAISQLQSLMLSSNSNNPAKVQAALPDLYIKAALLKLTFIPFENFEGIPEPICKIVMIDNQYQFCVPIDQV